MTLRELNQLRYLQQEIRLENQRMARLERSSVPDDPLVMEIREHIAEHTRKCTAEAARIERYVDTVDDSFVRVIMKLRFVDGLKWKVVAAKVGGGNTEDSVKKAVYRYLEENDERKEFVP